MKRWLMVAGAAFTLATSCLLVDPLDDVVPGTGTGTGGGGGGGGGGGAAGDPSTSTGGGGSGTGGAGGTDPCTDPMGGACGAATVVNYAGAGSVVVTDIAQTLQSAYLVMVGTFTGTVTVAQQQLSAGAETNGFLLVIDNGGDYVSHRILEEVDAGSVLFVDTSGAAIAVGGTYTEGTPCTGPDEGVFARSFVLDVDTPSLVDRWDATGGVRCQGVDGELTVHDVAIYGDPFFIQVAGSFDGTMGGVVSENSDGFVQEFRDVDGEPSAPVVLGGGGDAVVKAVRPNPANEWLIAGDFTQALSINIQEPESFTAAGPRDVFVVTFDAFTGDPNQRVAVFGGEGAAHRVTAMDTHAGLPERMWLVGWLGGQLDVAGQDVPPVSRQDEQAFVLDLDTPQDTAGRPAALVDHFVLHAPSLELTHVAGREVSLHLGGRARGPVTLWRAGVSTTVPALGCETDLVVLRIRNDELTLDDARRCGDGAQALMSLSRWSDDGFAAAVRATGGVFAGGDGGGTAVTGTEAFLLLQPGQ